VVEAPRESHEPFPCTELQGAYLMARDLPAQLGGRGCRIYIEVDLPGADGAVLEEGFNRLVRRHPMLRTVFPGDGTQRTLPEVPRYALRMEDLSALAPAAAEERCAALRDELSRTDLDPATWPLFDVRACRVDGETVRLFFSLDMLQVDFLSFLILMDEWRRLHDDPAAELPALPMHFNQYVDALGELRHDRRYQEDREFWLERIERFPQAPPLPVRTETDDLRRPDFASVGRVLSAETWARIQELAASQGVTPSAVLGTAYCRALTTWSGTGRFALNLPLFNRYPIAGCEEIDRPVGPFTTNVLLAVDLDPDAPFWDQARRFHATTMEALEHRLFTGVELTRALLEHRRRGLAPVAPVVFTPALYRGKEDLWGEIRLALSQTAMVWLDCIAVQDGARLRLFWDFVESLFDRADLEARFDRFVRELESLAADGVAEEPVVAGLPVGAPSTAPSAAPSPVVEDRLGDEDGRWADWPFMPREDWLRVREVNDTGAWYPRRPLHELIAEQTERDPGAPAIFDGDRQISYGELAERSNQVAQALVRRGVEAGSRVAVMMRRGAEPVVAILGALKAGAAYVPVDPGHPLERRLYTLRHCEPTVILSQAEVLEGMPDLGDLPVLDLADPEISGAPKDPVRVEVSMGSPAYLIYTSGSTGRPKGAVLTHGNAVNTCYDVGRRFGIGPGDRFMGFSSLAFDLSVFDLFGSLIHGAALVILPEASLREPAAWMDLLVRHGVTVWNSVPTGVKMLVDFWEGRGPDVPSLRLVMMSGDWIPVDLPDRLRGRFPNARVMALGGPTECTIWQNWYPVGSVDPAWTSIPYGKPLANHRIYVFDDELRPVPLGEVGQMYLAGDGVGLGYWNDPEKTDAAFLVHPVLQERMYRSGDLGRYLPDMTLEILGRVDHQVKIRGFRIELGEIEAALRAHPAVDTAVVVAWKDRLGENRLAAFYTASAPVPGEELRELVGRSLPDYMVPSRLEQLSALPLNDNAKIDRKTLARRAAGPVDSAETAEPVTASEPVQEPLVQQRPEPPVEAAPPTAGAAGGEERAREVERILLSGWRELFGVADLDPEDNFFELGGNSQLAVRAIRSASETLGVEIQVADLFSYPTIRKLSVALAERMPAPEPPAGPIEPASPTGPAAGPEPPSEARFETPAAPQAAPREAGAAGGEERAREVERILLSGWRELFGVADLDPEDNFFELGGNSQLAVRAIRSASEVLGVEIQVADLFSYPTIRKLSVALAERMPVTGPAAGAAGQGTGAATEPATGPAPAETGAPVEAAAPVETAPPVEANEPGGDDAPTVGVGLPAPPLEAVRTAYALRRSWRELDPEPLPRERLVRWLESLRQLDLDGTPKYLWGSAGGLYPVQAYLQVKSGRVEGLDGGTYYVDPEIGALVRLADDEPGAAPHRAQNRQLAEGAAFALYLVGELRAIRPLYGDRAHDLSFIEAGLMTQVLEQAAPEQRIGFCQVAGVAADRLSPALELGPDRLVLHTLLGGGLSEEQVTRAAADGAALRETSVVGAAAEAPPLRSPAPSCLPTPEMAVNPYAGLRIPQGVAIYDPDERDAFKKGQPGVRRDLRDRRAIALGQGDVPAEVAGRYAVRRSWRRFSDEQVPAETMGRFLARLRRLELGGRPKHRWASAGGSYAVATYLHVHPDRVEGLAGGLYRYRPEDHRLVLLCADASAVGVHLHFPHNREIFETCAFSVHLVGDLQALEAAEPALDRPEERHELCLVEAGLITQMLDGDVAAGGIGLCHVGDMRFDPIAETLGLGEHEVYLHTMLCGVPHPDERRRVEADQETLALPEAAKALARVARPAAGADRAPAPEGSGAPVPIVRRNGDDRQAIAVIGMAGRFPRAESLDRFWELLRDGTDLITEVPPERWDVGRRFDPDPDRPGTTYARWGAFLEGIEEFDPLFFKLSPAEARVMDSQQRLLLELGWETLERAGYAGGKLSGSATGVFVGSSYSHHREMLGDRPVDSYMGIGSHNALIANRLSYVFDLHGPSLTVDTLCSSSLVALHLACASMRRGECDSALVGAAQAEISPRYYEALSRLRALSPTGRCHTFDRSADGFVPGEGAGMVLLKPLERALADGDPVLGVIRGTAVNHGGHSGGLTVPTPIAQAALIRTALDDAGVDAGTIGYLEAHGTGTSLGDPIEVDGLTRAFREDTDRSQYCAIGSLKSNLGHLEPAAGVGALIKVLLALRASELPPTLHVREPNPEILFEGTPFYVVDRSRPWQPNGHPRRAGISGFGMGGANAHVIVEEAPRLAEPSRDTERPLHALTLSARSETALTELARRFADHFQSRPETDLGDAAFTANTGRALFAHRLVLTAADTGTAAERLGAFARGERSTGVVTGHVPGRSRLRPVFLFAGQGAQKPGAGLELYRTQPVFRGALDRCAEILDGVLDRPLLDLLLDDDPAMAELLRETRYTQPALFALEVALAELWRSWGVEPAAVVGHSLGEYVAACVAGVFSLEDGLRLVAERGRLMQELPEGGAMAALAASEVVVRPAIEEAGGSVVLAAVNGPESTVVSGDRAAVEAVMRSLEAQGVRATALRVSHAFHSPRMDPILDRFEAAAARIVPATPRVPLVSNVLGRLFAPGELPDAAYWRRHVRQAVRFGPGLEALAAEGHDLFLELGPGATLTGMGRKALGGKGRGALGGQSRFLVSLAGGSGDWGALLRSLGTLHTLGSPVSWDGFDAPYGRRRVPLPTTPFERTRCWVDPSPDEPARSQVPAGNAPPTHPLLGRRLPEGATADTIRFERRFVPAEEPLVDQHRVLGVPVLPGVGQIEMMVAAARQVLGDGALAVQDLAFTTPFVFAGSEPRIARVEIETRQGALACRVVSWPESDASGAERPVEHSRARLVPRTEPAPPPRRLPEAGSALSPEEIYRRAEEMGLGYGAIFRSIRELRTGAGLAVARLDGPSAGPGYLLEPGLLDGAFQALGTLLAVDAEASHGDPSGLYVPFALGELVIHGPVRGPVHAVAVRSGERGEHGSGGRGDIALLDLDGRVLVEVTALSVRRMPDGAGRAVAGAREDASSGWLLRRVWHPVEVAAGGRRELEPGTWLLVGDGDGLAEALARRLEARGLRCRTAVAGDAYGRNADGVVTLRPNDREDWRRLIEELEAESPPLRGFVHLWGAGILQPEPGSPEELRARIALGVESLAVLARAAAGATEKRELWVVTRGAEAVGAGGGASDAPPVPERAAALALARVVRQEVPRLTCRCLDLPPTGTDPGALAAVLEDALRSGSPAPEAAWRPGGLLTPDLEPSEDSEAAPAELPERAVVWITGGLGDLGLELAREMVRARPGEAAPRLVLQGRTPLPPKQEWPERIAGGDETLARRLATVQELEAAGAEVWTAAADVSDLRAMEELADAIETRWGAPFAIVHTAGIVRDGLLRTKELETFRDVLRPKVEGGWILDRIARRLGAERLVLFSSVVGVAGNPGQGDYAAANAYLDALALGRVAAGRPTVSLGWGPWDEVGMAARAGIDVRALGIEPIPLAVGRRLALRALTGGEGHRVVLKRVERAQRVEAAPERSVAMRPPGGRVSGAGLGRRLEDYLAAELGGVLGMAPEEIDRETNFMELGFDSLMAVKLQGSLADASGVRLEPTLLFEHPSIRELAQALAAEHPEELDRMLGGAQADAPAATPEPEIEVAGPVPVPATPATVTIPTGSADAASEDRGNGSAWARAGRTGREIAVVGLACRFPGATTPEAFWELIRGGADAIREVPPERWDWRESFDPTGRRAGTTRSRWGGFLDQVDEFDPGFFGLSPREAKFMDPQQRLFLEVVWEALERAGYRPAQLAEGRTGVFVGIAASDYGRVAREGGAGLDPHMGSGSVLSMVPNRVSYLFDWKGPSMAVDTACSSSLVALDLACRSLRDGEAEMAVVGGSNLILTPDATVVFSQAGMLSGQGRCMTFDDRADGYVRGEGVAALLLEPLDRALSRGDDVWAVIRDVVVNHDGHSKASLTAPNPKAQRDLLLEAFRRAEVSPDSLGLIEAHGTGTSMGDPIEIRGLTEAFRHHTDRSAFCAIGSAKSNVGHLEPAAGMAGLVKAILALRHRELPPTLHLETPNRKISFEETPFYVADRLRSWPSGDAPRRAGVSSFGFGGVNAHAVLEEAPAAPTAPGSGPNGAGRPVHLFKLSARSPEALRRLAGSHVEHLDRRPDQALADLCFTSTVGRCDFEHRAAFVVARREDLRHRLARLATGESHTVSGTKDLYGMLRDLAPAGAALLRAWCSGDLWSDSLEPALTREGVFGPAAAESAILAPELWNPVLDTLAALYVHGVTVDWDGVERGFHRRKVSLPTYPFERRSCWVGERGPVTREGAGGEAPGEVPAPEPEPTPSPSPDPSGASDPAGAASPEGHPISREELETFLLERVAAALEVGTDEVALDADLMTMGLESVSMMELVAAIRERFGFTLYPAEVLQRPSIQELAAYLEEELRASSAQASDRSPAPSQSSLPAPAAAPMAAPTSAPEAGAEGAPASPVFLLSSPRSGSTLLRVMLAGHPRLFCPPELHLLGYESLGEWAGALGTSYLGEGLQRALMELEGVDAEAGARRVAELTGQDLPVGDVYGLLRERAGGRVLVDKSPSYASDLGTVLRAEKLFERPLYLGLVRHPHAVVESFVRKRMHRLLGIDGDPYDVAEEIWRRSYRNLLDLRSRLGEERVRLVRYEDLVRDPEPVLREVCAFLGVPFDAAVLTPYEGDRMTDGVHPESMAIGDPDFHRHRGIDPSLADAWKRVELPRPLGDEARRLVAELGYPEADAPAPAERPWRPAEVLVPLRREGRRPPLFCFHPAGGQVLVYRSLAERLGEGQPVWALQSRALDGASEEHPTLAAMAADYAGRIRELQPAGEPYRLLGWSMGGHLALAVAAELESAEEDVAFVALWDSRRSRPQGGGPDSDPSGGPLRAIASAFGGVIGAAVARLDPPERDALVAELSGYGPEERIRRAVDWAQSRGVLSSQVPLEALVAQVALVETHVERIRRHEHQVVRAPIHVWWAQDDLSRRPTTDWSRWSAAGVHTSVVPGNHFTMVHGDGLERLATELAELLERLGVGGLAGAGSVGRMP